MGDRLAYSCLNKNYITSTAVTADFEGDWIDVINDDFASFEFTWSNYDGGTGAVNVQGTNDPDLGVAHDDSGTEGALTTISDASGSVLFRITEVGLSYGYVRIKFYMGDGNTATIKANSLVKKIR